MTLGVGVAAGLLGAMAVCGPVLRAAAVVLPQERNVFWAGEAVEVAVAGLARGQQAKVEIVPTAAGVVRPVSWLVVGDGGTVTGVLPPDGLAPGSYAVALDGQGAVPLAIVSGVRSSTMPLSQTTQEPIGDGGNFYVSNAFCFGLLDGDGQPLRDVRGRRSQGIASFERTAASGYPALCYMYWTGYVTHKPFGSGKSWPNAALQEAMRLLSFSAAQRLRRYAPLWLGVGPIDEPGLSWGRPPGGGTASGFPNWDEQPWYEHRGWSFTQDIAGQSDAGWLKYLAIRCGIIRESYQQAKEDLKTVWPGTPFAGDLYALHAIMDGTDGLNQQANEIPTTHVFFDWSGGPMSVPGQLYLEKCHAPTAKVAHAMNGQLEGVRGPQRPLYHWLMNGMLQAGLASNWWLNTAGMASDDLQAVNRPVAEWGPWFREMAPEGHDLAVLWSFSELAMREKEMARLESDRKGGGQIRLMVPMPEGAEQTQAELQSNAYEVGGTYANQVLGLHQVLRRAGYAAHVLHENLLSSGVLRRYRVLCIVGQTAGFPAPIRDALADFVRQGGMVLCDRSSSVRIEGAVGLGVDLGAHRLRAFALRNERLARQAASQREASVCATNLHLNEIWREAVPPVKAALALTRARPVVTSDSVDLSVERHRSGDSELIMVLNGAERYPTNVPTDGEYPRYNPAPARHTYTLQGIPPGASVWCIEGLGWGTVGRLPAPSAPITADFAAGEMKLYFVVPATPRAIELTARIDDGRLAVAAALQGHSLLGILGRRVSAPWPLQVTIWGPDHNPLYGLHRSTDRDGRYAEALPLGMNAAAGSYSVAVASPVGNLKAEARAQSAVGRVLATTVTGAVCVVDREAIRGFLAGRPEVTVVHANDVQRRVAEDLAAALSARGVQAEARPEVGLLAKVSYPRVLDPYVTVYTLGGGEKPAPGEVRERLALDGTTAGEWRRPNTLVTVRGDGFLDWAGQDRETAYGPGVRLYVDDHRQVTVLNASAAEVRADSAFRMLWCRPWTRLESYVGNYQLPPQLPEAYACDSHLVVLGDSASSQIAAVLQASEILSRVADAKYPGPGKALIQIAWSPFTVGRNAIFVGAPDITGLEAGAAAVKAILP